MMTKSALAGIAAPGRFGREAVGVTLSERQPALILLLARKGRKGELAARVRQLLGADLPLEPRCVTAQGGTFIWAGPGRWLAMWGDQSPEAAEAMLQAALGDAAALIGQSSARGVVRIAGLAARAVLAKGLPIDLHPRAFRPGDTALTLAEQIAVQIWQLDEAPTYDIAFPRSMAGSFWHWLTGAAAEFGYEVTESG